MAPELLYQECYTPIWSWLTFFVPFFLRYRIECTAESLRFGYLWPAFRVVALSDIVSFELVPELRPLANWGGWGYRINSTGVGYISQGGAGIKLVTKGKEGGKLSSVYFSCKAPEELLRVLSDQRKDEE